MTLGLVTMFWISIPGLEYLSPEWIIGTLGAIGVLLVLFVETGLLVGLVLPGDSMLFLAGIAASETAGQVVGVQLPLELLLIGSPLATFSGSQLGYWIGKKFGPKIFNRPDGRYFTQKRVKQTEEWLLRYGVGKALFLSRFIPIVRTLINPVCGVAQINFRKFLIANALSASIWAAGFVSFGYLVGERIKGDGEKFLLPITLTVIVLSLFPLFSELIKIRRNRK